jgi:hypothetical protein
MSSSHGFRACALVGTETPCIPTLKVPFEPAVLPQICHISWSAQEDSCHYSGIR